jgi:hypothetical protein
MPASTPSIPGFASFDPATVTRSPGAFEVLATQHVLLKPLAWAGQSASAVKHASDQSLQFLADWLARMIAFMQTIWEWSSDQIVRMTQAPWENWPLWKQFLFAVVAALVVYALLAAARQLWWAAMNVLNAVAGFVGVLIVTLPTILLAGAIALAGLWIINNVDSLSSPRSIMTFPGSDAGHPDGTTQPDPANRHDPAETSGDR